MDRKTIGILSTKNVCFWLSSFSCFLKVQGKRFSDIRKNIKYYFHYFYFSGGGIPTLDMLMVFMKWSSPSWSLYTKDVSNLTKDKHDIFELWCKVQVCHVKLYLLIRSLYRHWPLQTRVCRHKGTWWVSGTQVTKLICYNNYVVIS